MNEPSLTPAPTPTNRTFADRLALLLGTGLGVGYAPWAPGTVGSLWGPALVVGSAAVLPGPALVALAIVFVLAGPPICTRAAKALGRHDPGSVVYDEIAAFWIVFLPQLVRGQEISWPIAIAGFVLFRIFDIAKPWPVNQLEKLPDGTGIMADDLAAGAWAGLLLYGGEMVVAHWMP